MNKFLVGSVFVCSTILFGLKRYFAGGVCHCTARLNGLVVIVTGATSGIGKALAYELAERGATVIIACRNVEKGKEVAEEIINNISVLNHNVYVKYLNLASIESILKFSSEIKDEYSEIYALVNNAGIFYHPQKLTEDGYEITFQTNYLGHFVLTHELLGLLKNEEHARIVNIASEAHRNVNAYDLNAITRSHSEFRSHFVAYGVSKLALILFTRALSKKLQNTNIIVNAANPGNVETDIFRNFPYLSNWFLFAVQWPIRKIVVKTPRQGAQTPLHCLLTSNRSTGQYYSDCKLTVPSPLASDDKLASKYYDLTVEILDNSLITESEC